MQKLVVCHHVQRGRVHQCRVQLSCHLHGIRWQSKDGLLYSQVVGEIL